VRQARLLVTAIDDLDFVAKIHSSAGLGAGRVNLRELVDRMLHSLREQASARGVEVEVSRRSGEFMARIEPELADRLIFRLASAVIECAAKGERLRLTVDQAGDYCRVSVNRPARLRGLSGEQLFGAAPDSAVDECFSLRLTSGLAHIAGVELAETANALTIQFPRA
jgi:hypothetical protein